MQKSVDKGMKSWYYMQAVWQTAICLPKLMKRIWKKFLTNDVFGDIIKKFRAELEIAMKQEQKPAWNRPCTL